MDVAKAVIFDQGGVLTAEGGKGTNEHAVMRAMGLTEPVEISELLELLKRGKLTNDQFIERVNSRYSERASRPLTDAMWDDIYQALRKSQVSMAYRLADRCRKAGLRVGLLSNINPGMASRLLEGGLYKGFDPCILSCEVGYAKPDPQIYELVESQLRGIEPQQILLIDDQEKCVKGAEERGWQTVLATSTSQMIRDVTRQLALY